MNQVSSDEWLRVCVLRKHPPAIVLREELRRLRTFAAYVASLASPEMERIRLTTTAADLARMAGETLGWDPSRPRPEADDDGRARESEGLSRAGVSGEAPTKELR